MSALMAFLGVIGFVAVLMWRLAQGIKAARYLHGVAKERANLPRKMRFRSKTGKAGLQLVADPREAAALLMLIVASAGGEITKKQKDAIINQITGCFELSTIMAEELLSHVSWLSKELPDISNAVPRMSQFIREKVSAKELIELEDMLMQIAHADGDPSAEQKEILNQFALLVGI